MDLPAWRAFADAHGLLLFEDAAHAAGLTGPVGEHSDAAAFSFFTNKNMTTAEGGMVLVADEERRAAGAAAARARHDGEHAGPRPGPRGRLRRRRVRATTSGWTSCAGRSAWCSSSGCPAGTHAARELTGRYRAALAAAAARR